MSPRTIFLSDAHIGAKQADALAFHSFVYRFHPHSKIVLVGDVVDNWVAPGARYDCMVDVMRIRGNHDPDKSLPPRLFHLLADGRRALVIHGHQFDTMIRWPMFGRIPAILGARFNDWLMRKMKFSLASLVAQDNAALLRFYLALTTEARRCDCSVVICGHTHQYGHWVVDGVEIFDCGCWLRGCKKTYLIEGPGGSLWFEEASQ